MWDKFKNLLVEDEPGDTKTATAPAPAGQPAQPQGGATPMMRQFAAPTLNEAMVAAIRKATYSRNTALTALITASEALTDIIPDPVMRLKAAHKTAGAGRSGKDISDAVAIHLNDVDGEERRFAQMLTTKVQGEVGGLGRQAEALETAVQTAGAEIQNLQQRITQLQQQMGDSSAKASQLRAEAQTKEGELRHAETEFKAAAQAVRDELNGHKNTILSTLG